MTRDVFISRWSAIAGVALALAALMGIASCKRGEDNAAPETQETSAGDANVARVARDFGPALLKIATEYWIYHHEDYNSLLYAPHCGFIDLNGKIVIEPKWEEVRDFSEGIGLVKRDGKWGWFDKAGRLTEPSLDSFPFFHEGLTKLERGGKWGFMDTKGTVVIKPEWEDAGHFSGGYAAVKRDGKWGGIDKTGRLVMPFGKYEQLQFLPDPGMWLIKRDGK